MPEQNKTYPIEETYFILKKYLAEIQDRPISPNINEKTDFNIIRENIDKLLKESFSETKKSFVFSINDLHTQLSTIVYLSDLSYFYIKNSGLSYYKLVKNFTNNKNRLINLKILLNEKIQLFKTDLEALLEVNNEDSSLKRLAICYNDYLENLISSDVSKLAQYAASIIGEIDFEYLKNSAKKDLAEINKLLEEEEFFDAEDYPKETINNLANSDAYLNSTFKSDKDKDSEEEDKFFDAMDKLPTSFFQRILNWFKKIKNLLSRKPDYQEAKSDLIHNAANQISIINQTYLGNLFPIINNPNLQTSENKTYHRNNLCTFFKIIFPDIIDAEKINFFKFNLN